MSNGVTFVTEGGNHIGMGHLSRCVNLARALKRLCIPAKFLVNDDASVIRRLEAERLDYATASICDETAAAVGDEVVVIDTKKDLKTITALLKESGKKVVSIDNDTAYGADAIIIPSAFYRKGRSAGAVGGSEFVIIGENFQRERRSILVKRESAPFKILVTMGGADPYNLTELVVNALERIDGLDVTVVMGPAFRESPFLKKFIAANNPSFRFLFNVADMAPLMSACDLAFTAVGTTVYELAYMGVPSVIISNYPADERDMAELKDLGISFGLGYYKDVTAPMIRGAVKSLMKRATLLDVMASRARSLTDGLGGSRIADIIAGLCSSSSVAVGKKDTIREVRHA